jgi:hypothetical protein
MKKIMILLLLFIPILAEAYQPILDTNNQWNIATCISFGGCGTMVISIGSDTTINGNIYQKIIYNADSAGSLVYSPSSIREDTASKKVYLWNGTSEELIYDFSLNLNDTFTTSSFGCVVTAQVTQVDSVQLLDGSFRKRIILQGFYFDEWIEGIGSTRGLVCGYVASCSVDFECTLVCFSKQFNLLYQDINFNGCFINTTAVDNIYINSRILFYPNPISKNSTLHLYLIDDNPTIIKIYNLTQQMVYYNYNAVQSKLDLADLNLTEGIYTLIFTNDNNSISRKLIITE